MTTVSGPVTRGRPVTPVSILAAKLEILTDRIDALGGVTPELTAELHEARALACRMDPYLSRCTTPESPALRALARRTRAEDWCGHEAPPGGSPLEQEMLSGHLEGQTLKFLVFLARARRVLELGMFTGYSALAMAEALPDDGELVACELDAEVARFARQCLRESPHGEKISIRIGPARVALEELAGAGDRFDLVFIDADKAAYLDYLNRVLDLDLLAPHGVICVDNTLMQGQAYGAGEMTANGAAIAAFNQAVVDDRRVEQVVLPVRDGLTLIRRAPTG